MSGVSVMITYGIQTTNVVTMTMKVLHNSCNMCTGHLSHAYVTAIILSTIVLNSRDQPGKLWLPEFIHC